MSRLSVRRRATRSTRSRLRLDDHRDRGTRRHRRHVVRREARRCARRFSRSAGRPRQQLHLRDSTPRSARARPHPAARSDRSPRRRTRRTGPRRRAGAPLPHPADAPSRDFLEPAAERGAVATVPIPDTCGWSDLGTVERLEEVWRRLGRPAPTRPSETGSPLDLAAVLQRRAVRPKAWSSGSRLVSPPPFR